MTEIKDVKVYDLEECIVASSYAMRTDPINYDKEVGKINYYEFESNSMKGDLINFVYGVRKQQRERLYNDTSKNKKNKYEKRYF